MKLELKHLAAYLPYGVRCIKQSLLFKGEPAYCELTGIYENSLDSYHVQVDFKGHKEGFPLNEYLNLILRPLSDLEKKIEHNRERFVPSKLIFSHPLEIYRCKKYPLYQSFKVVQKLLEWRFDVFGLIEAGLAIDVNTLNENPYEK